MYLAGDLRSNCDWQHEVVLGSESCDMIFIVFIYTYANEAAVKWLQLKITLVNYNLSQQRNFMVGAF